MLAAQERALALATTVICNSDVVLVVPIFSNYCCTPRGTEVAMKPASDAWAPSPNGSPSWLPGMAKIGWSLSRWSVEERPDP